jgi:pimeloyl-ACP methyl ester carboxylesterase
LRSTRVAGIVGIAAAPDFISDLLQDKKATRQLGLTGQLEIPSSFSIEPYIVSQGFVGESRMWNLADKTIPSGLASICCPVHLLRGKKDIRCPLQHDSQSRQSFTKFKEAQCDAP